ncbi:MAG: nitrous oxide reductase accessory protein NosL [Thermodesulfobacteriota bacterium]
MIGLNCENNRCHLVICVALFILIFLLDVSWGADLTPRKPSKQDKCPVCGMFVYKYPDWIGQVIFKDGTVDFFDGAKDLFKYYLNLKKYNPKKAQSDIAAIYVSEYYKMRPINAYEGFFVVGSDVYGPMGRELIPLSSNEDAETFKKDHRGKQILKFQEITPQVLKGLD